MATETASAPKTCARASPSRPVHATTPGLALATAKAGAPSAPLAARQRRAAREPRAEAATARGRSPACVRPGSWVGRASPSPQAQTATTQSRLLVRAPAAPLRVPALASARPPGRTRSPMYS